MTYRIRRVKCDETKPECTRCTTTGRHCDGYPSIFAPANSWEVVKVSSVGSIIRPSSNPRTASNDYAGQSFRFFQTHTVGYLSGLFKSELWDEVILRAAHHNDAIWHATIALGSAHKSIESPNGGLVPSRDDWALQQYNLAMRSLTQPNGSKGQPSVDVMIAASVLFMCFEVSIPQICVLRSSSEDIQMLRREHGKAISHFRGGIRIFAEQRDAAIANRQLNTCSDEMIPLEHLEVVLRRVEIQLCELSLDRFPPFSAPRSSLVGIKPLPYWDVTWPRQSAGFNSIDEARLELDAYWHNMMFMLHEFFESKNFDSSLSAHRFASKCEAFHIAFVCWRRNLDALMDQLKAKSTSLSSQERKALILMELHQIIGIHILETLFNPCEMQWDAFKDRFNMVIDLCGIIIGEEQGGNLASTPSGEKPRPGFHLDMGIVAPLFHVLWKCRDARIRYRAIKMLEEHPRQDGLWDGRLVAIVGRQIDAVERGDEPLADAAQRGAAPEEIQAWARIRNVDPIFFVNEKKATVTFLKQRSQEDDTFIELTTTVTW